MEWFGHMLVESGATRSSREILIVKKGRSLQEDGLVNQSSTRIENCPKPIGARGPPLRFTSAADRPRSALNLVFHLRRVPFGRIPNVARSLPANEMRERRRYFAPARAIRRTYHIIQTQSSQGPCTITCLAISLRAVENAPRHLAVYSTND